MSKMSLIISTSLYDDHNRILKVSTAQGENILKGIFILCARALHCFAGRKALPIKVSLRDCKGNSHDTFSVELKPI